MSRTVKEANRAIGAIGDLPYGPARTQAALGEVKLIESEGPLEAKAYALHVLVDSYMWGREPEKTYVPFTQELAWYDSNPEMFDQYDRHSLFWSFKWMVSTIKEFPQIPADQIDRTLEDMAARYAAEGWGADALAEMRFEWALHRGDPRAEELFQTWLLQERDDLSNCEICVPGARGEYLIEMGRLEAGIEIIEQTLQALASGQTSRDGCSSEPGDMHSIMQLAYLDRGGPGDAAKAAEAHRRSLAFLDQAQATMAAARGRNIAFLARARQVDRAVRQIERNADRFVRGESPLDHLAFLSQAGAGLRLLAERLGQGDRPVTIRSIQAGTIVQLWDWVWNESTKLATVFDQRNGTSSVSDRLNAIWTAELVDFDVPLAVIDTTQAVGSTGARAGDDEGASASSDPAVAAKPADDDAVRPAPSARGSATRAVSDAEAADADPATSSDPAAASGAASSGVGDDGRPQTPPAWLALAEQTAANDPVQAAAHFLAAAQGFDQAGDLAQAGFAYAEAGQLAGVSDDLEGAAATLAKANARLTAAETDVVYVFPVVRALARFLSELGRFDQARATMEQMIVSLDGAATLDRSDQEPELAERDQAILARTRLDADDALARLLCAGGQLDQGAELAERTAERFAQAGQASDAAYAFDLAGHARLEVGQLEPAAYCLESAMEGFALTHQREERGRVANTLIDVLRQLGRPDDAERLASDL